MTEVSDVLIVGDDDVIPALLSRVGQHTTDTGVSDDLTALTPDSVTGPATATEVASELLLGNEDLSPVVLHTSGTNTELTDNLTALMTGSVTLL